MDWFGDQAWFSGKMNLFVSYIYIYRSILGTSIYKSNVIFWYPPSTKGLKFLWQSLRWIFHQRHLLLEGNPEELGRREMLEHLQRKMDLERHRKKLGGTGPMSYVKHLFFFRKGFSKGDFPYVAGYGCYFWCQNFSEVAGISGWKFTSLSKLRNETRFLLLKTRDRRTWDSDVYVYCAYWRFYTHRIHGTGIFTYIWLSFMVNVGKYTIHESYGICFEFEDRWSMKLPTFSRSEIRTPKEFLRKHGLNKNLDRLLKSMSKRQVQS